MKIVSCDLHTNRMVSLFLYIYLFYRFIRFYQSNWLTMFVVNFFNHKLKLVTVAPSFWSVLGKQFSISTRRLTSWPVRSSYISRKGR